MANHLQKICQLERWLFLHCFLSNLPSQSVIGVELTTFQALNSIGFYPYNYNNQQPLQM